MKRYIVFTHVGPETTVAASAKKALANVRWRLRQRGYRGPTDSWEVKEAD